MLLPEASYSLRLFVALVYTWLSAAWTYTAVKRLPVGRPRVLAVLPLLIGNFVVPLLCNPLTEVCTSAAVTFLLTWLASFKELGYALDRGPLCTGQEYNLFQFWSLLVLPISPRFGLQDNLHKVRSYGKLTACGGTTSQLMLRFVAKLTALGVIVSLLQRKDQLPLIAVEVLYATGLYAFLGFLSEGPASLIVAVIRIPISPHFDEPYRPTSVADFWGRRWNITASNTLRFLIYDPIQEGRFVHDSKVAPALSNTRRLVASLACFFASGVVHEVIFWYLTGVLSWDWLIFFTLQGPLVLCEMVLKKLAKRNGIKLPAFVSVPITLAVLIFTAHLYFFPPCMRTGLADRVVNTIQQNFQSMLAVVAASRLTVGLAT